MTGIIAATKRFVVGAISAVLMYADYRAFRARLLSSGAAFETKDGNIAEIKSLLQKQGDAFEEHKKALKERDDEVKKLGAARAETETKLDKIGKTLDEVADGLKAATKRADEIETRLNRPGALGGGKADDKEMKALADHNLTRKAWAKDRQAPAPADLSIEEFRAVKAAANKWLRYGAQNLSADEAKALSVGSDPDGGYWVPADTAGRMVSKIFDTSPIRQIAAVQSISRDALEGVEDINEAGSGGWVAEAGSRSDSSTPQIGKWRIPVHEQYAQPKAAQTLLDDAVVDVEGWLANKVADKLARTENAAFVTGDGVGKPKGFTAYTTAATADASRTWGTLEHIVTGTNASLGVGTAAINKLIDVVTALKPGFRQSATWVFSRSFVGTVRKLTDGSGGYVWLPNMQAGAPASLLGYPITEAEDMPAVGTGSLSVAFGNFAEGYQIVDRLGIRVLRDPYTDKPYVKFYTTKRVGGAVLNFEAIKFLKFST